MIITPGDIEVLLHYHTNPEPHPRRDAPAIKDTTERFIRSGLIKVVEAVDDWNKNRYITTDKGRAFVKALCNTPLPTQAWIDGYGNIIKV